MNNFNVVEKNWIDMVFENRNKSYGAYQLRNDDSKNTVQALITGLLFVTLFFLSSFLFKNPIAPNIVNPLVNDDGQIVTRIIDFPQKPIPVSTDEIYGDEKIKDQTVATIKDVIENIRFVETNVVSDDKVLSENLAAQNQFSDNVQSGQSNIAASSDGTLNTAGVASGTQNILSNNINNNVTSGGGSSTNDIVKLVQQKAKPHEGYERFIENFVRKFPKNNISASVNEIVVKLKFVVEKDGSFTNIEIVQDQYNLGADAVKVLKAMPKWEPAKHNGQTVRSSFVLPIKIKVNN